MIAALALAVAATLSGSAIVIDGDTLDVAGKRVRLAGIDAPEWDQVCWSSAARVGRRSDRQDKIPLRAANSKGVWACGSSAHRALAALVRGRVVRCTVTGTDKYNRALVACKAGRIELNSEMVRSGWAVAYRRYSDAYVGEEEEAKAARRGIWSGTFKMPEEWRHER